MKKYLVIYLALLFVGFNLQAQTDCPDEWQEFTNENYFSSIQQGDNEDFKAEDVFFDGLYKSASKRLLKTISVSVHNTKALQNNLLDENSILEYFEKSAQRSDFGLKLIEKKQNYNSYSNDGCLILYIEKAKARDLYSTEIAKSHEKISNLLQSADKHIASSKLDSARFALEACVPEMLKNSNDIFLLYVFGEKVENIEKLQASYLQKRNELKEKFSVIGPKVTVAIECYAELFGTQYWNLQESIKDWLSAHGYGFSSDKAKADWVLTVKTTSRKYNSMSNGSQTTYFSFVEGDLSLQNAKAAVNRSEKVSIKGSFTKSYEKAAEAGYDELGLKIMAILESELGK